MTRLNHQTIDERVLTLRQYLGTLTITPDNIGAIRGSLFLPYEDPWNSVVREETARREGKGTVGGPIQRPLDAPLIAAERDELISQNQEQRAEIRLLRNQLETLEQAHALKSREQQRFKGDQLLEVVRAVMGALTTEIASAFGVPTAQENQASQAGRPADARRETERRQTPPPSIFGIHAIAGCFPAAVARCGSSGPFGSPNLVTCPACRATLGLLDAGPMKASEGKQ